MIIFIGCIVFLESENRWYALTAVLVETGAMPVPTKSQNPTVCGWGGPFYSYLTPKKIDKFFPKHFLIKNFFSGLFYLSTTNPWHGGVY